ncbi:XRE family transcriptional regulator [Rhodococcus sp. HNM0569]|nr:helix-turn-helix transcriptional regulator [Rhodococcus sp. HNM0569]NLU84308.1 XRE family transcriptional regulator [Rhodococcus sp. HNM0569]
MHTATAPEPAGDAGLGAAIRARRLELGRTLVQVARDTGLSHPFLSQIERGRARPSMRSLYLVATALGTTQQTLLARGVSTTPAGRVRTPGGDQGVHAARLVDRAEGAADVTEMVVTTERFEEFFRHTRRELVYVVAGVVEVELHEAGASEFHTLAARESVVCPGGVDHRHRRVGGEPAVVLLVHSGGSADTD